MKAWEEKLSLYPSREQLEEWVQQIRRMAEEAKVRAEVLEDNGLKPPLASFQSRDNRYVRYESDCWAPYYGYFQPAHSKPAPLLVHVPVMGRR